MKNKITKSLYTPKQKKAVKQTGGASNSPKPNYFNTWNGPDSAQYLKDFDSAALLNNQPYEGFFSTEKIAPKNQRQYRMTDDYLTDMAISYARAHGKDPSQLTPRDIMNLTQRANAQRTAYQDWQQQNEKLPNFPIAGPRGFGQDATRAVYQSGGDLGSGYATNGDDLPMLQNPNNTVNPQQQNLPRFNPKQQNNPQQQNRPGFTPQDALNDFNFAAKGITGIGNEIQNSRQKREEYLKLQRNMAPKYFTNMEGEGLHNVPAFTQFGGYDRINRTHYDQNQWYGGGIHGEGHSLPYHELSVGPNFGQYSRGIPNDIAPNRNERDVPVAPKPGRMPQRYMLGGADNRSKPYLEQGGYSWPFGNDYLGLITEPIDPGYAMYGWTGFVEPQDYSNMNNEDYGYSGIAHNGPWGQNSVYKNGGEVSSDKAKEILRDGTVHGQPLTDKQKRYFGWLAGGGKSQTGGNVAINTNIPAVTPTQGETPTPAGIPNPTINPYNNIPITEQVKQNWNRMLDYVKKRNLQGSKDLDIKNKNLGNKQIADYNKDNPQYALPANIVGAVQQYLANQRLKNIHNIQTDPAHYKTPAGFVPNSDWSNFDPDQSKVDNWFGSKTSSFYFPDENVTHVYKRNGKTTGVKNQNLGLYERGGDIKGGLKQDGGNGFAIGDEIEMSLEMFKNLKKQGYKFKNL